MAERRRSGRGAKPAQAEAPVMAAAEAEPPPTGGGALTLAGEETKPSGTESWLDAAREPHTVQTLLSGIVAWATTVAPAALGRDAPGAARFFAVLALLAGITGQLMVGARKRIGRHVGLTAYLALATLSWLLAGSSLQPTRLDPTRAAIGAVAWGVFALSWSDPWRFKRRDAADPNAPALQARAALPPF